MFVVLFLRVLVTVIAMTLAGANAPVLARVMETSDADIAQQATPAVVNLSVWKVRQPAKAGDAARRVKTSGSGFIIDPTGIIVTNKHVIDGAIDVTAVLSDGSRARARLITAAAMIDLAILKVDVGYSLPVLKWGDSDTLRVGDAVLTIGNPLGIGTSVSAGIVSALNRDLQDTPFDNYIQTDSAINHGNSGGPMINRSGEVVGIDTALYNADPNGGFIGIGFAIPSSSAKFVVDHLLDPSHPKLGWLGVTLQDVTAELAAAFGMSKPRGAIVAAIDPNGPASKASLRPGDILEGLGKDMLDDSRAFMRAFALAGVGRAVQLTIWRDGKQSTATATIAEWPNIMPAGGMMSASVAQAMIQKPPDPGVQVASITDETRQKFGIGPTVSGVVVTSIENDCEASSLGVVVGDVISVVQGVSIATPDDVKRAMALAHDQNRSFIAALVVGKTSARWISLSMGLTGT